MRRITLRATSVLRTRGVESVHRSRVAPRRSMLVTWFAVVVVGLAGLVSPARAATPRPAPPPSSASSAITPSAGNPGVIAAGCCEPSQPTCEQGDTRVAYNDMPFGVVNCLNPAEGFECCNRNSFGDEVILAGDATNPGRKLLSLRVLFGSFACQSGHWDANPAPCQSAPLSTFTHPITASIYNPAGPGGLVNPIASVTQPMTIPYRPSADALRCPAATNKWFNLAAPNGGVCQNSISTVLIFTGFGNVTLPDEIVWTVAFKTTSNGIPMRIGPTACSATPAGCPYDSLNVGTKSYPGAPFAGTDPDEATVFTSTGQPPSPLHAETNPCPGSSCWIGFRPLGEIITG